MAGSTTGAQLTVGAFLLGTMAIRAGFPRGQPDMRLVAVHACLVPLGGGLLFGRVATPAGFCLLSGVGLMAADAARMAGFDLARFALVAVIATDLVLLGGMRQPLVAAGTRLVALVQGDLLDPRLVAALARRHVAQRELESVRLVAAGARGGAVRPMVGRREFVTRRASANLDALGGA